MPRHHKNVATIQVAPAALKLAEPDLTVLAETTVRFISEISECTANDYIYSIFVPQLLMGADMLIVVDDALGHVQLYNRGDDSPDACPNIVYVNRFEMQLQSKIDELSKIVGMKIKLLLKFTTTSRPITFSLISS